MVGLKIILGSSSCPKALMALLSIILVSVGNTQLAELIQTPCLYMNEKMVTELTAYLINREMKHYE